MNKTEFRNCLEALDLTPENLATILSVSNRTVSRWLEDSNENVDIAGPLAEILRTWTMLKQAGLPWKPSDQPKNDNWIQDQVTRLRELANQLEATIHRVKTRGGPSAPWKVDLKGQLATLGPIRLSFYRIINDNFSPGFYSRSDKDPDFDRDMSILEDAIFCIDQAIQEQGWPE
jgi:transcriptional regulator with XRE-family HTH domain